MLQLDIPLELKPLINPKVFCTVLILDSFGEISEIIPLLFPIIFDYEKKFLNASKEETKELVNNNTALMKEVENFEDFFPSICSNYFDLIFKRLSYQNFVYHKISIVQQVSVVSKVFPKLDHMKNLISTDFFSKVLNQVNFLNLIYFCF